MGILDMFRSRPMVESAPAIEVEKSYPLNVTSARDLVTMLDGALGKNSFNTQFDYQKNVREGYLNNPVAFYCINLISQAAIQPAWELYVGETEIDKAPKKSNPLVGVYNVIQRPNSRQSLEDFIRQMFLFYYLAGEVFVWRHPNSKSFGSGVSQLILIDPSKITISGQNYVIDGKQSVPMVNPDGTRDILHITEWHPLGDRGLSHLQPAWASISNYNQAQAWNHSVLSNSAKLSIIAVLKSVATAKGSQLTKEQIDSLNEDLSRFSSPEGRGKPFVASGDWDFKELGMDNQELEWLKGMEAMARNIALALGVDPVLLSLPGDSTYSNKKEALSSLFKNTAMPRLQQLVGTIEHWLKEVVPGDWEIRFNMDDVPALEPERETLWARQRDAADILSVNERREMLGYEAVDGGDEVPGTKKPEAAPAPAEEETDEEQTDNQEEGTDDETA